MDRENLARLKLVLKMATLLQTELRGISLDERIQDPENGESDKLRDVLNSADYLIYNLDKLIK